MSEVGAAGEAGGADALVVFRWLSGRLGGGLYVSVLEDCTV